MGVAHGPLRKRYSGKGRAVPERLPVDPSPFSLRCAQPTPAFGCCGSAMVANNLEHAGRRVYCSRRKEGGRSPNGKTEKLAPNEARVVAAFKAQLQKPRAIERYLATYRAERKRPAAVIAEVVIDPADRDESRIEVTGRWAKLTGANLFPQTSLITVVAGARYSRWKSPVDGAFVFAA